MDEREIKYQAFVKEDLENNHGRIVNACEEIRYLLANNEFSKTNCKIRLEEMLEYATKHSSFYKKYSNYHSISDFPVLNKQDLKDHWEEICVNEYKYLSDTCSKCTSGSTGTPFKLLLDRNRHSRWIAGNKIFREIVGVRSHDKSFYYIAVKKEIPLDRQIRDNVYYDYYNLGNKDGVNEFVSRLMNENFRSFTMLASGLEQITFCIDDGSIEPWKGNLKAIFSMSDALKPWVREKISNYFKCPVFDMYGNEEFGVIASEDGSGCGFRCNVADLFFEVLNYENDEPVEPGKLGRLVVTDLYNKAFPLIRYEVGDMASIIETEKGVLYITQMAGRKLDMLFDSKGHMVSYYSIIPSLKQYMDIKQFQLIQDSYHDFKWILNTDNHSYENSIIESSKHIFGEDTNWSFEYVNEIPKLRSGKYRIAICNIKR